MKQFFSIERIKQAVVHLRQFDSYSVLVPLVFAVNGVTTSSPTNINEAGRPGSDKFLKRFFNGELMGLPAFPTGINTLRPRFRELLSTIENQEDFVLHQNTKLWANGYSSRGYRELRQRGLVEGKGSIFSLTQEFFTDWDSKLPDSFRFEELLVWLYAFTGFEDSINSWSSLRQSFEKQVLGSGKEIAPEYHSRFREKSDVEWPTLLTNRPTNEEFQRGLIPSGRILESPQVLPPGEPHSLAELVEQFGNALTSSGINFGSRHTEITRTFMVSLVTKGFVILTGLSGSGKTQIALKLGEWIGPEYFQLVPVRPDWSSGDALFGFEDALDQSPERRWFVPPVLSFLLTAAGDEQNPYLLILDEMNLAHVERYFGDFLSGMETHTAVIPNLELGHDGRWRPSVDGPSHVPIPNNLFIVGTVNVDETTYMFSPKVLDRANVIEFRVRTEELQEVMGAVKPCLPADNELRSSILRLSQDERWHRRNVPPYATDFSERLKAIHGILSTDGLEFGHRVYQESLRYAAFFESAGGGSVDEALDLQVIQKILPRLHGSVRRIEPTVSRLSQYCYNLERPQTADAASFDPRSVDGKTARLPRSFAKLARMFESLKTYHFASFIE